VCLHARTRADNLAVLTNDCSQLLRTVETGTGLLQQGTPSSIVNDELGHDLLPERPAGVVQGRRRFGAGGSLLGHNPRKFGFHENAVYVKSRNSANVVLPGAPRSWGSALFWTAPPRRARSTHSKPFGADGDGFHLLIKPGGSKLWRFRDRFGGIEKMLSLGAYPAVSLASARAKRDEERKQMAAGTDPSRQRKLEKAGAVIAGLRTSLPHSQSDPGCAPMSNAQQCAQALAAGADRRHPAGALVARAYRRSCCAAR
jgi:Arm DNA-binding domain